MANGVNRSRRDKKSYTFTMSMPDVVWTGVGAVFALTVFFLFGVLVGRGYLPAEPGPLSAGQVAPAETRAEDAAHGQLEGAVADSAADPANEVLKAEDLAYQDQLDKPEAEGDLAAEAAPAADAKAEATAEAKAPAKVQAEAAEQQAGKPAASGAFDPANLPAPEAGEQVYRYTYQAAAFKDEAAASALADKLKTKGLDAKVSVGKTTSATWYRVQVPFTGTPSQTRPLRDAVQAVTGEKPVMVSKKSAQ